MLSEEDRRALRAARGQERRRLKAHIWAKHKDNWYVEPSWTVDALFRDVSFDGEIHDPCCGKGTIPDAAVNAGYVITCADVVDRGASKWWGPAFERIDYQNDERMYDNIVTNPPFDFINKPPLPFVQWAVAHARRKAALLVPFKWFGGDKRSRILENLPLSKILILTPRPSMPPGEVIQNGEKPGGGKEDFAWAIFDCRGLERRKPTIGWLHRDKDA
jgi:hypothetical protein